MTDTVRIERPFCCRRHEDLGGRTKQDSLGNIVKVKTRARETLDDLDPVLLERSGVNYLNEVKSIASAIR